MYDGSEAGSERGSLVSGSEYTYGSGSGSLYTRESMGSESREEYEYYKFLKRFGHMDFTLLDFLPLIKTVDELREMKRLKEEEGKINMNNLISQNKKDEVTPKKYKKRKRSTKLEPIKEE